MKKLYLVFCLTFFSVLSVFAQPFINIPDANFKAALVGNASINTIPDGEIDSVEAASYTGGIGVFALSINDMTGIEAFTSITFLDFSSNPGVTSVTLPVNPYLTDLACYNCGLGGLDISGNPALTTVNCAGNNITSLDLSNNLALQTLFCQVNNITSFDVSANTALVVLDCSNNNFTSIDVSNNTALTNLYVSDLSLTSLDVSANTNLSLLDCSINSLTSLDLSSNTSLVNLNCAYNSLASLDLINNYALMYLQCQNNPITDLNLIPNWQLTDINVSNNLMTCLDLHNNSWLTYFTCFNAPNLVKLNLKNGANTFLTVAVNCPSLGCVQVDDSTYSATNWANFGGSSYFSNDCGQPSASFIHNAPVCSGTPVQFDQTTANIDWFVWNFGDGDTSTVMVDPSHLYVTGGSYFATLTAGNCYGIAQPNASFDLGAPIGGYIDYSGGGFNAGNAILLEYEPVYHTFDTIAIQWGFEVAGYYSFGNVYDGQYIVKVHPDTAILPNVIPTYSGNQANWETATIINHTCFDADTMDITLLEITPGTPGSGSLSGEVIEGAGFGRAQGDPIHGVDVKLGLTASNIIAATITDTLGQYSFTGIPDGTYTIYVDIPGLLKDSTYTLTIAPGSYVWTYLDYEVDSNSINIIGNIGIQEPEANNPNTFTVYPNPVKSNSMIRYTLAEDAEVKFDLYNMYGVNLATLLSTEQSIGEYYTSFNPDALGLRSGVYFITCTTNGKSRTQRIVVLEK